MEAGIARFFFMGQANLVSIRKTDEEIKFLDLCEKCLVPKGFRIVDVDCSLGGHSVLRVFVERPGNSGEKVGVSGVSIEDCAQASRELDPILETENWLPTGYDLEVSSPGLERRLRLLEDFRAAIGEEIKLKLVEKTQDGSANVTGPLRAVTEEAVTVVWQKKEIPILFSNIRRANRVWSPGQPGNRK